MTTRAEALRRLSAVVDDSLNVGGRLQHDRARIVGWKGGLWIAAQSYLPEVTLDADIAAWLATDLAVERGWLQHPIEPDYYL